MCVTLKNGTFDKHDHVVQAELSTFETGREFWPCFQCQTFLSCEPT